MFVIVNYHHELSHAKFRFVSLIRWFLLTPISLPHTSTNCSLSIEDRTIPIVMECCTANTWFWINYWAHNGCSRRNTTDLSMMSICLLLHIKVNAFFWKASQSKFIFGDLAKVHFYVRFDFQCLWSWMWLLCKIVSTKENSEGGLFVDFFNFYFGDFSEIIGIGYMSQNWSDTWI